MADMSERREGSENPPEIKRRRRRFIALGIFFVTLAVLVAVYGTVAYIAWQRGQSERIESELAARDEELASQMDYARENISAKNYSLALRRIEWILDRDSQYPGADELLHQAQTALNLPPTIPPIPTATDLPVTVTADTQITQGEPADNFAILERLMEDMEWPEAVSAIVTFQNEYPDFRRQETDQMLYDANINLGLILVNGDQVELGLYYLAQAEKLGDLPLEVEDHRTWADLYLSGIGYYGVNWATTVYFFRGLCAAAPFYQNSCVKFHESLIAYGDQYAVALDWCPAQELYAEAYRLQEEPITAEKLETSIPLCEQATPTPEPTVTTTIPLTGTIPSATTIP